MNIVINDFTYNHILSQGGKFTAQYVSSPASCGWVGSFGVFVYEVSDHVKDEHLYNIFDYRDIKICIDKKAVLSESIDITFKPASLFFLAKFKVKGISF